MKCIEYAQQTRYVVEPTPIDIIGTYYTLQEAQDVAETLSDCSTFEVTRTTIVLEDRKKVIHHKDETRTHG